MEPLLLGLLTVLFGLFFVVIGLWQMRVAENADQELIERKDPLGGGRYVTPERLYNGAVFAVIVGFALILFGIVFLLI